MSNIVINGIITTKGPLSITMPDTRDYDGFPLMSRGVADDGKLEKTGILPATTIRGFLRRAIVMRDMRKAAEDNNPYTLQKAYAELIGQDAESEKQAGDIDLIEIKKARESSPTLDLFGSGLGVASRLRVSHFVPEKNILPEEFKMVRKDLGDTEEALELLSPGDEEIYHKREAANRSRSQQAALVETLKRKLKQLEKKGEDVTEVKQQLDAAEKLVDRYEDEMGEMQNSSRSIMSYFALPADIDLMGKLVVLNATDRDIQMIEFALDCLSRNPVLGANSARGCGEIAGRFEFIRDGEMFKKMTLGGYKSALVDDF
jgi:hypothetical protein